MADKYVLLLRGINVNPSTRIAMADLRDVVTGLGYTAVKTILQSGNVIVESEEKPDVAVLEAAIVAATKVKSRVVAVSAETFRTIVNANPLLDAGDDLSRMVVTFLDGTVVPADITYPTDEELAPEKVVITSRAIYQWCPDGILKSKLKPGWWKQFDPVATSRNVRTANRILDLLA